MDNISIEAYAFCCLLPFIAFLLLALQLYLHAPARPSLCGRLAAIHDDLANMHGLITIAPHTRTHTHAEHSKQPPVGDCEVTAVAPCVEAEPRERVRRGRGEALTGCSAGLAKMRLINQRYLRERQLGGWEQRRSRTRGGEWFKPTSLPVIVEGLQY